MAAAKNPGEGVSIPDGMRQQQMALDAPDQFGMQADALDRPPQVMAACEREWPAHSGDCSAFVRAVAADLGVPIKGNADGIVAALRAPDWVPVQDGAQARKMAEDGMLVIAGLRGADQAKPSGHGHVVVVVPGPLARDAYPTAYWGTLGGRGEKAKTLNFAWVAEDRDRLTYAAHAVG